MTDPTRPTGLALSHMWVAFITFLLAAILGAYQALERSGLIPVWDEGYYLSVSAHGNIMAYVLTTFFIVGFGYYVAATSLKRPIWNKPLAWLGFLLMVVGVLMIVWALVTRNATVLYTFYPPLTAHWAYYVGAALLVVGSLAWVLIMIVMAVQWKRDNRGAPLPLAMFGTTINALNWLWTLIGVVLEVVFLLIPLSTGMVDTVDVGLARTFFAWTLHPIVYFWLIPAYIALYVFGPPAAGGRLFSDEVARVAFIMLLVFGLPIGFHHLYLDPFQAAGWKLFHGIGTFMVAVPTLITGFTVIAGLEIAGRLHGGKGLLGWIGKLPWNEPMVLAGCLSLVLLMGGGFGGMINASYSMNTVVHNTMWVPGHFHLIFGGTVIIMYMAIAYHLWPKMTGKQLPSKGAANLQIWLWFIGMLVLTLPWHWIGLTGQPRRTAWIPYDAAVVEQWTTANVIMGVGGVILTVSALLFIWNLIRNHLTRVGETDLALRYAEAVHPPHKLPQPLNGFALWNWILVFYMTAAFGYPIAQFFFMEGHRVAAWGW